LNYLDLFCLKSRLAPKLSPPDLLDLVTICPLRGAGNQRVGGSIPSLTSQVAALAKDDKYKFVFTSTPPVELLEV
jgi:hypothetical protein